MKILFVNPPYLRFIGARQFAYHFPIGLGYLATVLENNGLTANIYDAEVEPGKFHCNLDLPMEIILSQGEVFSHALQDTDHFVWQEIKEKISSYQPDILGISVLSRKYPVALRIAEIAKKVNPEIKVIFGNHHPTIFAQKVIQQPNVDYVVIGEGEITILELIRAIKEGSDPAGVDGIVYKKDGKVYVNRLRDQPRDLDVHPFPNRRLILDSQCWDRDMFSDLITARGCPYPCTYCGTGNMWGDKVRYRSVDNTIAEMQMLYEEFGVRHFSFCDDSFTMKQKRVFELCDRIRLDFSEKITWSCITRLDLLNESLLAAMKASGCCGVATGIESGNDEILATLDRKLNVDFVKKQSDMIKRQGVHWTGLFMLGLPGETKEQMYDTLNLMREVSPDSGFLSIFNPLPNTGLYHKLVKEKKISVETDWSSYSQDVYINSYFEGLTQDEFHEVACDIVKEFQAYNREKSCEQENPVEKYRLASIMKKSRNWDLSLKLFRDLIEETSQCFQELHAGAHFHMGEIYNNRGDLRLAIQEFQKCIALNPEHKKASQYLESFSGMNLYAG